MTPLILVLTLVCSNGEISRSTEVAHVVDSADEAARLLEDTRPYVCGLSIRNVRCDVSGKLYGLDLPRLGLVEVPMP